MLRLHELVITLLNQPVINLASYWSSLEFFFWSPTNGKHSMVKNNIAHLIVAPLKRCSESWGGEWQGAKITVLPSWAVVSVAGSAVCEGVSWKSSIYPVPGMPGWKKKSRSWRSVGEKGRNWCIHQLLPFRWKICSISICWLTSHQIQTLHMVG